MASRIRCWRCEKKVRVQADRQCPACGAVNRKESLGYRLLMLILYADVAFTLGLVVYLAASCG